MKPQIPQNVIEILTTLENAGYEAYAVGGCVRDFYLGVEPHDWDITTSAKPDETKALFNRTIDTGIKHGTVTAMLNGEGYEITTYRIDGEYEDNRRPSSVEFTSDLSEDLKRRDFTFNAMVMDKDGNIKDLYGGMKDLDNKIVKCVGDPNERFQEDALRMMRAIRFAAKFGFELDEDVYAAIKKNASLIQNVSFERIESELTKILTSDHPENIVDLYYTGIMDYIVPEFSKCMQTQQNSKWHCYDVGMHSVAAVASIENDKNLRWTMFLHDIGKPVCKVVGNDGYDHFMGHDMEGAKMAEKVLDRMKMSNSDKDEILNLIFYHDIHMVKMHKIRKFVADHGIDFARKLIKVQYADVAAQSDYELENKLKKINTLKCAFEEVEKDKTAINIKDLAINGNDLIEIGYKGKEIGKILNDFRDLALNDPRVNTREKLLVKAKERYSKTHNIDDIIKKNTKNEEFLKETINKDVKLEK